MLALHKIKLKTFLILILFLWGWVSSLSAVEVSRLQRHMGTVCEITLEASTREEGLLVLSKAFEEIKRLEKIYSSHDPKSEVVDLQKLEPPGPIPLSPDLFAITNIALELAHQTEGAFDPTLGPLLDLWDTRDGKKGPSGALIRETLKKMGHENLALNPKQKVLHFRLPTLHLDFGGIGKGYALDQIVPLLKTSGISSARINFGGIIVFFNDDDPLAFSKIELSHPLKPSQSLATFNLSQGAVSTSSQHERFSLYQGNKRGHILNPKTGRPSDFEGSVTVHAPTAAMADGLSTAFLVMGPKLAFGKIEEIDPSLKVLFLLKEGDQWKLIPSPNFNREDIQIHDPSLKIDYMEPRL